LTTEEVKQILDALKTTEESVILFVYFGIFRQRYFNDQGIAFNGDEIRKKLSDIIVKKREENRELQARIVRVFWKILKENLNDFDTLKPYIDLFLKQPYQKNIYHNIEFIMNDVIEQRPDVCIQWFELLLDQIYSFIASKKQTRDLWLVSTYKVMMAVARHRPDELEPLTEKLVYLSKKGVHIRSPKKLFETFKLVSEKDQREIPRIVQFNEKT